MLLKAKLTDESTFSFVIALLCKVSLVVSLNNLWLCCQKMYQCKAKVVEWKTPDWLLKIKEMTTKENHLFVLKLKWKVNKFWESDMEILSIIETKLS